MKNKEISLEITQLKTENQNNDNEIQQNPFEIQWENVKVVASIKSKVGFCKSKLEEKTILHDISGICRPSTFTAILGPSGLKFYYLIKIKGSGKTTLLNLLSGRLQSNNLTLSGQVKVNNEIAKDITLYSNLIAYVQQDDILFTYFTPKEAFNFSAQLRLQIPQVEKEKKVDKLIQDLGLTHCQNTKIGSVLVRGVSGGERKRTSIGVELLTNPSLIFLDEPTTGLDSSTALNLMKLIKRLANEGKTIISTIHQPSSDIFNSFDKLILLVEGHTIYCGDSDKSLQYFEKLGFKCQAYANPADYYMQCMNPEGLMINALKQQALSASTEKVVIDKDTIKDEFEKRIQFLVKKFKESDIFEQIKPDEKLKKLNPADFKNFNQSSIWIQLSLIFSRALTGQLKNPRDLRGKFMSSCFMALLNLALFVSLGTGQTGIQNRQGCIFFTQMVIIFMSVQTSLSLFSTERALFLREVLNKSYSTGPYYFGKILADLPFGIIICTIYCLILYFALELNLEEASKFFIFYLTVNFLYFAGTSYGLCLSIFIKDYELAMSLVPMTSFDLYFLIYKILLVLPQLILAGFLVNSNDIPVYLKEFEYTSIFRYGFQALIQNELEDLPSSTLYDPVYCKQSPDNICQPLEKLDYNESIWTNIWILFALGVAFRLIAFYGLKIIGRPVKQKFV